MRSRIVMLVVLLALLPAKAAVEWSHDLGIGAFDLDYRGKTGAASTHEIPPGEAVSIKVEVKNNSRNPSMPYKLDVMVDNQVVASQSGSSLMANGSKVYTVPWVATPGRHRVIAQITLTRTPPGGDSLKRCGECSMNRGSEGMCSWPSGCTRGASRTVCSCHVANDLPSNNRAEVAANVGPGPGGAQTRAGLPDLVVDGISADTPAAIAKTILEIRIGNNGDTPTQGPVDVLVEVAGSKRMLKTSEPVMPGKTAFVRYETLPTLYAKGVKVTVDPSNRVKESNESNNSK